MVRFPHREEDCRRFRRLNALLRKRRDRAARGYVRAGGIESRVGFMNGIRSMERSRLMMPEVDTLANLIRSAAGR